MSECHPAPTLPPEEYRRIEREAEKLHAAWEAYHTGDRSSPPAAPDVLLGRPPEVVELVGVLLAEDRLRRQRGGQPGGTLPEGFEALAETKAREGGMGVVHKARQVGLNRVVAVKMIRAESPTGEGLARFRTEAEAVAKLRHPGIVQVHQSGEHNGRPFLVLEFVEGGSLAGRIARGLPGPREAARWLEQLARAVAYAHEHGVLHRDLKPANVLLTPEGAPKVTDFGLARKLDEPGRTVPGMLFGTPSYMAPEQAAGAVGEVTVRTDVYGLGAILYEALTGRPPFPLGEVEPARRPEETLRQVRKAPPKPPREFRPRIPADLETVCLKCLAKDPDERYASAADLAEDLRRFLAGEPITARPVGPLRRVLKWARRQPVIAGLSGLALVALVTGAAVSVAFGLQAQEKESQALKAVKATEEKHKALQESLAVGFLRPLGHSRDQAPLGAVELEALGELACWPRRDEQVRLLFVSRALEKPGTAGQLGRRLEESVIAAVGLRQDLRERVICQAATRLQEARAPREVKVVCARVLAQLRCREETWVELATDALLAEMARETDWRSLSALAQALAALPGNFTPEQTKQAAALTARLVEMNFGTSDAITSISQAFTALAAKMPAGEATALAGRVLELVPVSERERLLFAALAHKVLPEQAPRLADRITELAAGTNNLRDLEPLARALAALAEKLPAEQAGRHASVLAGRIIDLAVRDGPPDDRRGALEGLAVLADKVPVGQAPALAGRIVELAVELPPPIIWNHSEFQRTVWKVYAALADKVPAGQAARLADRIVASAAKAPLHSLGEVSKAFARLAGKLPAGQAGRQATTLAARILNRAAVLGYSPDLVPLSEGFTALSGQIPAEQVPALAARMVELIPKSTHPRPLGFLWEGLRELAGKVPPGQASGLAERIVELAGETTDPDRQAVLAHVFLAVADKLPAERAGKCAAALANGIVKGAEKSTAARPLRRLSLSFVALAGKIPPEQAGKQALTFAGRILDQATRTAAEAAPLPVERRAAADADLVELSAAFAAQAAKVPPEQVPTLVGRALELSTARTIRPSFLHFLSEAFAALTDKLPAEQARKHAAALATRIAARAATVRDPNSLCHLSKAFAAVADQLPVEQAGRHGATIADLILLQAFWITDARSSDQEARIVLADAFKALAPKLPAGQASTLAGQVVEQAAQAKAHATYRKVFLLLCFTKLAGKVPAEQASALASRIVELADGADDADTADVLSRAFAELPGRRTERQVNALILRLARLSHQQRYAKGGLGSLDRLLPQASSRTMVEALKQPSCVGTTRAALLEHLGRRYQLAFRDVWELVDYLQEAAPELGLDAPPLPE
jgi:hypothetical protein